MTADNGNGELRKLLEIKRGYRRDLTEREAELKAEYEREVAAAKKELKEKYLEKIVDTVFADPAPAAPKPEPAEAPVAVQPEPTCPECDSPVDPTDKFCAECAAPLNPEDVKNDAPVVSAGRKFHTRVRR